MNERPSESSYKMERWVDCCGLIEYYVMFDSVRFADGDPSSLLVVRTSVLLFDVMFDPTLLVSDSAQLFTPATGSYF